MKGVGAGVGVYLLNRFPQQHASLGLETLRMTLIQIQVHSHPTPAPSPLPEIHSYFSSFAPMIPETQVPFPCLPYLSPPSHFPQQQSQTQYRGGFHASVRLDMVFLLPGRPRSSPSEPPPPRPPPPPVCSHSALSTLPQGPSTLLYLIQALSFALASLHGNHRFL